MGNAGQFVHANDESLSITDNASLSTGDIDFTFACWIYWDDIDNGGFNQGIATKGLGSGEGEWYLYMSASDDKLKFVIDANGNQTGLTSVSSPSTVSAGQWSFVVCWHDSVNDTVNIQIDNGTVQSTATGGSAPSDRAGVFQIGRWAATGEGWNGRIDEAAFWKKILTTQERSNLYNSGAGNTYNSSGTCTSYVRRTMFPLFD